jgi:hypothetical protein
MPRDRPSRCHSKAIADTIRRPNSVITLDCRQLNESPVNQGSSIMSRAAAT